MGLRSFLHVVGVGSTEHDVHAPLARHPLQVHPVVSRLVSTIEGTDAAHIADCLGLDPAR
jgi:hypothetical protein